MPQAYKALAETTVQKHVVFEGHIITVRNDEALLPNQKPCRRELVEHPGGVCVAALTDQNELLFVRQFRYPYGEVLLELPAGKLERGEDPLPAGRRELQEETGTIAAHYEDLGEFYPSPGYCGEVIHCYLATGLTFVAQHLDDDEFLTCERIPLPQAVQMVRNGEIKDGKTQAMVLKVSFLF
ncbi:MAG: NUDIX hydrolase [Oscillospiraceae bacterium]|jgi:ADP-ribose pyrophosphatase|nr:NUDIX hydrolase [Oscillospiraceae bacterium]